MHQHDQNISLTSDVASESHGRIDHIGGIKHNPSFITEVLTVCFCHTLSTNMSSLQGCLSLIFGENFHRCKNTEHWICFLTVFIQTAVVWHCLAHYNGYFISNRMLSSVVLSQSARTNLHMAQLCLWMKIGVLLNYLTSAARLPPKLSKPQSHKLDRSMLQFAGNQRCERFKEREFHA